jgi:hypothetical protein
MKTAQPRGMARRDPKRNILFCHLTDVFLEACAVYELDQGKPPSSEIERLVAGRIAELAKQGELDTERLRTWALEGLIEGRYSVERPSRN